MSKRPELEVGQTIYVESVGWLISEPKEPKPYEVTKVNSKSIYAKSKDGNYEQRFDKKTWVARGSLSTDYIWLSTEDYWNSVKHNQEKKALRSRITTELSKASFEQLQAVAELLNINLK